MDASWPSSAHQSSPSLRLLTARQRLVFCTRWGQAGSPESSFRSPEKVPLKERRAKTFERVALGLGLDALANDLGAQVSGAHRDHRAHNARLAIGRMDVPDKRHVQLDYIGLELAEARQACITSTKVIDGYSVSKLAKSIHCALNILDALK